jgi:hypothetical protein
MKTTYGLVIFVVFQESMSAGALQPFPNNDVVRANVEARLRRPTAKFAPRPSFVGPRQQ